MERVKVVAHFMNGVLVKGYTNDFFPKKPSFHVGSNPSEQGVEVAINELKALFFVKDFEGNPDYQSRATFDEGKAYQGKKVMVTFRDGEKMAGTVLSYDKDRPGFFMVPADEDKGNNTRVFIVSAAVTDLKFF